MSWITSVINLLTRAGITAEFARFLVVGSINTGGGYVLYLAVLWSGASPVWAYNISYAIGILVSYLFNLKFTFRRAHSNKKMLLYPLVYVVQYVVGLLGLYGFLALGVTPELAGLFIIPLTVPITFFCARFFINLK